MVLIDTFIKNLYENDSFHLPPEVQNELEKIYDGSIDKVRQAIIRRDWRAFGLINKNVDVRILYQALAREPEVVEEPE